MGEWCDGFTNTIYTFGDDWEIRTRSELAARLQQEIKNVRNDVKEAANQAALFWKNYYSLVFPLRFGLAQEEDGLWRGKVIFPEKGNVSLGAHSGALRKKFLDGLKLPPILPSPQNPKELLSDHCLQTAALLNVLLRQKELNNTNPQQFHAIRLAALVHELALEDPLKRSLEERFPTVSQLVLFLHGRGRPQGIDDEILKLLKEVHDGSELGEHQVFFVAGAIQRIKQYVFETPGLSEIRGASTLLDYLVEEFAKEVADELGPEVVLRAAAATIEFLAPSEKDADGKLWPDRFRQAFYTKTGTAFAASAAVKVSVRDLVTNFPLVVQKVSSALGADRYSAKLPIIEKLPFEQRCSLCQIRPAEGWTRFPEGTYGLACRPCATKRDWGRNARRTKVEEVLQWLGIKAEELGVASENPVAQELSELIPEHLRRKLLAIIYGDGNNFGGAMRTITSLGLSLQWTNRIAWTIRAATALALVYATQKGAKSLGWKPSHDPVLRKLPFQILALGGDDLSLITWGRIGLYFCQHFLELTDLEFQEVKTSTTLPIRFSLGAIFVDEKAPVRRTVEFAEGSMLKWAKRAFRESQKEICQGNVAFILALNVDQVPTDLNAYRQIMFLRGQGNRTLCLTLRPFSSEELGFLLTKAEELSEEHKGRLHRMVQAFFQLEPGGAILHYLYQKAREEGKAEGLCSAIEKGANNTSWNKIFGATPKPAFELSTRLPFGESSDSKQKKYLFSPIWDLLEIVKILE